MPIEEGRWVLPKNSHGNLEFPKPVKGMRDAWKTSDIEQIVESPFYQLGTARGIGMDMEAMSKEAISNADDALKGLKATLDKFKSTLANDLTSIKASSTRVQNETTQMKQAYINAQAVLTTPDFERAIVNAERMAAALHAISQLQQTKVSVAVFNADGANHIA